MTTLHISQPRYFSYRKEGLSIGQSSPLRSRQGAKMTSGPSDSAAPAQERRMRCIVWCELPGTIADSFAVWPKRGKSAEWLIPPQARGICISSNFGKAYCSSLRRPGRLGEIQPTAGFPARCSNAILHSRHRRAGANSPQLIQFQHQAQTGE